MHSSAVPDASFVVIFALLAGCSMGPGNLSPSSLTDRERAIEVFDGPKKPTCKYDEVARLEATSGSATDMGTYESSIARLQRDAAAKGATGVIVLDHGKTGMADQVTGLAIRCAGP